MRARVGATRRPSAAAIVARSAIAALAIAALSSGCPTVYAPQIRNQRADITGVTNGGLAMQVSLTIFNTNDFDVSLDEVTANLNLNGSDLGTVESEQLWTLPAQQDTQVVANFVVPYTELPGLVIGAIVGGQVPYRVTGEASVDGAPVTVEYTYEGYVDQATLLGTATRAIGLPGVIIQK
jgi:LEA14-like dessication related protein